MIKGSANRVNNFSGAISPVVFNGLVNHNRMFRGKVSIGEITLGAGLPYAVSDLKSVGGSYIRSVTFDGEGKHENVTEFLTGEFPMEQSFKWNYHWGYDTSEETKEVYLDLQITNLGWIPQVGDFIKLRYMFPEITYCKFYPWDTADGSLYWNPDYYTFAMTLNGDGDGKCTVSLNTQNGVPNYYDNGQTIANCTFTPIADESNLLGFEVTGWLMRPITSIRIKLTGYLNGLSRKNAEIHLLYDSHDALTVEGYRTPIPATPMMGYLYGTPSEKGKIGLRSGDTVTYYNGVICQALPSSQTHPVCVMAMSGFFANTPTLHIGKSVVYRTSNGDYQYGLEDLQPSWMLYADGWKQSTTQPVHDFIATVGGTYALWTNADICYEDGTVAHAATEPIPVGKIVDTINNIPIYEDLR